MPTAEAPAVKKSSATEPTTPVRKLLGYGAGGVLDQWGMHGLKNTAHPILNIVLGLDPALIGGVLAVARIWDAFADPAMGAISDNTRSSLGRRRPYIILGAVLCGVLFPLCWWFPLRLAGYTAAIWLLFAMLLFYTAYTIYSIPYHALGYEIAPGYNAKTRVFGARTIFATITGFGVAWILPLTQVGYLGAPRRSVHLIALGIGFIILVTGLVPAFFARPSLPAIPHQRKVGVFEGLALAFHSRDFVILLGAAGLAVIGLNMVNILGTYLNFYYIYPHDHVAAAKINAWAGTLQNIVVIFVTPVLVRLARRWQKHRALAACFGVALIGTVAKWWLFTPAHPWWQFGVIVLLAPGMAGLWLLSEAMVGDISSYEAARNHLRTEGTFSAVFNWVMKCGLALGVLLSGGILDWIGFNVNRVGVQPPSTIYWLRFHFAFLPSLALVLSLVIIQRYRLTRQVLGAALP